jgi:hypothetical protein
MDIATADRALAKLEVDLQGCKHRLEQKQEKIKSCEEARKQLVALVETEKKRQMKVLLEASSESGFLMSLVGLKERVEAYSKIVGLQSAIKDRVGGILMQNTPYDLQQDPFGFEEWMVLRFL